jgi:tetratricopeptide (TPR) repeat protein
MKTRLSVFCSVILFAAVIHPCLAGATTSQKPAPGTAEDYDQEGHKYLAAKDYARAIEAFKRAVAIDPSHKDASESLLMCYMSTDQWQPIVDILTKHRSAGELHPFYLVLLGRAHRKLKNYKEAWEVLDAAIRLKPKPEYLKNAWFEMGEVFMATSEYEKVVSCFEEALRIDPNDGKPLLDLGLAYSELGQKQKALTTAQQAVAANPNNALALEFLGMMYVQTGSKAAAVSVYQSLLKVDEARARKLLNYINSRWK